MYNDAKARLVQAVQYTQEVFDKSLLIYAQKKCFANRYRGFGNKRAGLGRKAQEMLCIGLYIFLNVLRIGRNQ